MSRSIFYAIVLVMFIFGLLTAWMRYEATGIPLFPGEQALLG